MDLVKGAWFDLYELGGVIVNNRVTEEIIKITFGDGQISIFYLILLNFIIYNAISDALLRLIIQEVSHA